MKFLFITNGYPSTVYPSKTVFLQRLVNELVDQGHECVVIAPNPWPINKSIPGMREIQYTSKGNKVEVYFPRYLKIWFTAKTKKDLLKDFSYVNYLNACIRIIKTNNLSFDCIYAHFLGASAYTAVKIGRKYGKPVFAAAGESEFPFISEPDKKKTIEYLNKLTGIVSVSTENKDILIENGVLDVERIKVFPNGIDPQRFYKHDKVQAREKFGFNPEDFIIAFTGYFIDRKGPLRLLEAAMELNVKIAFAGSGTEKPEGKNVIWNEPVSPNDMPYFLSAADIFVLPTKREGCCNAIVEALACGLPVISSDKKFNDDILDEKCSIRVDSTDTNAIRDAITSFLNNHSMLEEFSINASKKGVELSLPKRAENIVEFITKIETEVQENE